MAMRTATLALAVLLAPAAATPQEQAPSPQPQASPAPSPESADIAILATVRWRELRFDQVGQPTVQFTDTPRRDTVWHADRFNLPTPVQPGVTYNDGGVRLTITTTFADVEKLLAEIEAEAGVAPPAKAKPAAPQPKPSPTPRARRPPPKEPR
jgi:hypothetical protein